MEKSTVYFTDFRCPVGTSQLDKLKKLCIAAGVKDIDMEGKFVAIKMHFDCNKFTFHINVFDASSDTEFFQLVKLTRSHRTSKVGKINR